MGKPTGFMEYGRQLPRRRPVSVRLRDWKEVYEPFGEEATKEQGARCMDCGIPFCHEGCPLGQPHPRMERPRLPGRLARGHGAPARHQQLPRVHRPAVPGPVRGRLRARDQRGSGHHRADRVRDRRTGLGRGLGDAPVPRSVPARRWRWWDRGRPAWRRPAAGPAGPQRHGLRAGREARGAAALRDPRVQDGEGGARPAPGAAGGRGGRRSSAPPRSAGAPAPTDGASGPAEPGERAGPGHGVRTRGAGRSAADVRAEFDAVVLAGGATLPRDLPVPGRDLSRHPPRHGVPEAVQPRTRGGARRLPDLGRGQARRHHRGRGHRGGLPGHRAPPGCGFGPPARDHGRAPERPAGRQPVATVAADPPHVLGPRGGGERLFTVTTTEFVDDGIGCGARPARPHASRCARGRPPGVRAGAGNRIRAASASSSSWPWASWGPSAARWTSSASRSGPGAGRGRRELVHQRRRGVRVRGPDAGPEPHRLGHRRGPFVRVGVDRGSWGRPRCRRLLVPASSPCADTRTVPASADASRDAT